MLARNSASNRPSQTPLGDDPLSHDPFLRPTLESSQTTSEMQLRLDMNEAGASSSSCFPCFPAMSKPSSSKSSLATGEQGDPLLSITGADRPSSMLSRSSGQSPTDSPPPPSLCKQARKCSNLSVLLLFALSGALLALSLSVRPVVNYYLREGVKDEIVVSSPQSPSYAAWVTNTGEDDATEVHYEVFIFHVANHEEVLAGTDVPQLVELGPYIYSEYFMKHQIEFSEDGEEVSYFTWWWFEFDEELSFPLDDVKDTALQANLVLMGARQLLLGYGPMLNELVPAAIKNSTKIPDICVTKDWPCKKHLLAKLEGVDLAALLLKAVQCYVGGAEALARGPFHVKSIRDLYFGYDNDETLEALKEIVGMIDPAAAATWSTYAPGITTNYTSLEDNLRRDGPTTVRTGKRNLEELGVFVRYANMTLMHVCPDSTALCPGVEPRPWDASKGEVAACWQYQAVWTEEEAKCHGWVPMFATNESNAILGTDASQTGIFPMGDNMQVFIDDLYRSSDLMFVEETDDWKGIKLRRYGINPADMESSDDDPSQADFYQFGLFGMENMTTAAGFPLFATKPHFLDGDSKLITGVSGLNPTRDIHDTFVDFEPITGVCFRASKRLQTNTIIEDWKLPDFELSLAAKELLKDMPDLLAVAECLGISADWSKMAPRTFLPYSWADESVEYSDQDAEDFKTQVYGTQDLADSLAIYLAIGAGSVFVCALWGWAYAKIVARDEKMEMEMVGGKAGDGRPGAAGNRGVSVRF